MNRARPAPSQQPTAVAGAPQSLELRHLRYFVALADTGSFTHAAERIFIAQPTPSQQIRRLEEIVGTPLLQRRRGELRLTTAGSLLLEASRSLLSLVDHEVSRTPAGRRHGTAAAAGRYPAEPAGDPGDRRHRLAFASAADRPTAVLTGPSTVACSRATKVRRTRPDVASRMVRVSLEHRPLTASAALVWSGNCLVPCSRSSSRLRTA
jgi:hypothetical protein